MLFSMLPFYQTTSGPVIFHFKKGYMQEIVLSLIFYFSILLPFFTEQHYTLKYLSNLSTS